jgi:uncharacterized protein with von Willebrand factor type A (vWA) domain
MVASPTAGSADTALASAVQRRLTGFVGFLRANGYIVSAADSIGILQTVARTGILDPQVLRWSLRALLCRRVDEWQRFDATFDAYFRPPNKRLSAVPAAGEADLTSSTQGDGEDAAIHSAVHATDHEPPRAARHGASREESVSAADFRDLNQPEHVRDVEALMRRFARRLRHLRLRRDARSDRGRRLDLQSTIRRSVATGGTPLQLAWRDPRRVLPRLVLLLDVSRSMSSYSFFYLRLARALSAELADVHVFIFHTRLTAIGEALRDPDPWRSQERLHLLAVGWGGGTRIGECLRDFNRGPGARLVHSRTGVIVVSDGYDTGEPGVLSEALATLKRRARRIVWLNPLLNQPRFTPESRGMRAALPYIDLLAPGADLAGLARVLPQLIEALR